MLIKLEPLDRGIYYYKGVSLSYLVYEHKSNVVLITTKHFETVGESFILDDLAVACERIKRQEVLEKLKNIG